MRSKMTRLILISAVMVAASGNLLATDPNGFTSTTVAKGQIGSFDVSSYLVKDNGKLWLSFQKTIGKSDGYVLSNVWQPGGSSGWHTHPSDTMVIVTAGTITRYEAHDPSCTPRVYTVGMGFVELGGAHVHIVRNEGNVEADAVAVRLVPAGQPGRIDAPDPGTCHF